MTPKQKMDNLIDQLSLDELKELMAHIEKQYPAKAKGAPHD